MKWRNQCKKCVCYTRSYLKVLMTHFSFGIVVRMVFPNEKRFIHPFDFWILCMAVENRFISKDIFTKFYIFLSIINYIVYWINIFTVQFHCLFPVVFHRDSLLITILLIVVTIILQGMLSFTSETPEWVEKVNAFMEKNRVGQLFLTKHLVTTVWEIRSHYFQRQTFKANKMMKFSIFFCRVFPIQWMKMPMILTWLNHKEMRRTTAPPKNRQQAYGKHLQILSIEFYSRCCSSSTCSWSLIFYPSNFSPRNQSEALKSLGIKLSPE